MKNNKWTREKIFQVSGNYWQTCTLIAGVSLGVFTKIGDEAQTAARVAKQTGCDTRGMEMLLNALTAMGLLEKEGKNYKNTDVSREYLIEGEKEYLGYIVKHHQALIKCWVNLDESVRKGKPQRSGPAETEEDRQNFILGMYNLALGAAPKVAKAVDLSGLKRLLDLGGGPGTYAVFFCMEYPELEAVVYDLPSTRPYAEKVIKEFNLSDRIHFIEGNYLEEEIPGKFDVVWVSHILHSEGPETCQEILDKVVRALEPEGILLVHDFFLDEGGVSPLSPALFSLNMLVNTEEGRSYTEEQVKGMLKNAGAKKLERLPFEGPNSSGIIAANF